MPNGLMLTVVKIGYRQLAAPAFIDSGIKLFRVFFRKHPGRIQFQTFFGQNIVDGFIIEEGIG